MKHLPLIFTSVGVAASLIANAGGQRLDDPKLVVQSPHDVKFQPLQGKWEGIMVGDPAKQKIAITVSSNALHFYRDTNFWFETTIVLPTGKDPQQLHATIQRSAPPTNVVGQVVRAIFKIEDQVLTLATGRDGDDGIPKGFDDGTRYELTKVQPRIIESQSPKTK